MIKKVVEDYKVLLRSIPAATVSLFFVSVIMMNLLANKELISLPRSEEHTSELQSPC